MTKEQEQEQERKIGTPAADRLRAFIRQHRSEPCRQQAEGEECLCPSCDVDDLQSRLTKAVLLLEMSENMLAAERCHVQSLEFQVKRANEFIDRRLVELQDKIFKLAELPAENKSPAAVGDDDAIRSTLCMVLFGFLVILAVLAVSTAIRGH